ncbi:MAG: dTDP-4-dehydrorhamnose reductase [Solirubrobacterales bacterium]|nr:dTDP-4-dehydrorhamnose reductase [Solirubrobacterales bacterium]
MRVLVSGSGGMLGHDVALAAERADHEVRALDRHQLDVTDEQAVGEAAAEFRPSAVIHCAGLSDIDAAEDAEADATAVNAEGARLVAAAAKAVEAKVVYVSCGLVFDGEKGSAYVESDEAAPLSALGRSKLAGETATATANPRAFLVRSSWLFGSNRHNFVDEMLQLAEDHGEVLAARDEIGSPTYTAHLAAAIVRLIEGESFGLHHMAAEGECSRYDFAREIFDQSRIECSVLSETRDVLGRSAARPAFAALESQRRHAITLPPWRDGLSAYLAERGAPA